MKKILFFALFGILLIVSNVQAISTSLKTEYSQMETIIFEINGNILEPINVNQIKFFRNNVELPLEKGLAIIAGKTYVWAIAPNQNGTFILEVRNISTTVLGQTKLITHTQNFSVGQNLTDYSVKPGVISTKEDFEFEVSLFEDFDKIITIGNPENREVVLNPGKNTIKINVSKLESQFVGEIMFGKYSIPANLIVQNKTNALRNTTRGFLNLSFEPSSIKRIVFDDSPLNMKFVVENLEEDDIKNLKVIYDKNTFKLSPENLSVLKEGAKQTFNLTFLEDANLPFSGLDKTLEFVSENRSTEFNVRLERLSTLNRTEVNDSIDNQTSETGLYRCLELGGSSCNAEQECNGRGVSSLDGACCIGLCVEKNKPSSKAWIGWLGVIIALGIGGFIFYKYKILKPSASPIGATRSNLMGPSAEKNIP